MSYHERRKIMNDPYKILGVSPTASDEEVKKAYLSLAKKYHPDKYAGSELADLAAEKMKEVNSAYDMITQMRKSGENTSGQSTGNNTYNTYGNYNRSSSWDPKFANIRRMVNSGNIDAAEQALNAMGVADRTAEWNFLMGCVCIRRGFYADAQRYLDIACSLDPYNAEYRMAKDGLQRRAQGFGTGYSTSGTGCSPCNLCTSLLCADCCCECMGGDIIPGC